MKNILLLATLLIYSAALAEDPKDLMVLRGTYDGEAKRAMQPINERYLRSLARLKDSYTKSAKLEEALAVETEIKRLQAVSPTATPPSDGPTNAPTLLETRWVGRSGKAQGKTLAFQPNGAMKVLMSDNSKPFTGWSWGTDEHGKPWIRVSDSVKEPIRFSQKNKRLTMSWGDFELQAP